MRSIVIRTDHVPPSSNSMFRNVRGKGRVRTKRYMTWARAAGWDLNGQGSIKGPFVCVITISKSKCRKGSDIDNRTKPVLDLLQTHGIIENDSLCQSITTKWDDSPDQMVEGMEIEISEYQKVEQKHCGKDRCYIVNSNYIRGNSGGF